MRTGEPSRTAFGAATHRAVHQDLEGGRVFRDPLAWRVLGVDDAERAAAVERARQSGRRALRLFIAVRHRFAEDALAAAVERGVDQAVLLGAGLDTFAHRNPHPGLQVFEVDHPDTGAWKRERLERAGLDPSVARYVGVDFERDGLRESLVDGGLDPARPAFVLWLGVVPYLTPEAVRTTLGVLASLPCTEVVLDHATTPTDAASRALREGLAARVAELGEPMLSTFEPGELTGVLAGLGYDEVEDLGRAEILPRYFGVDPGAVPPATGGGHVVRARVTTPAPVPGEEPAARP